jgi:hypothetical protein
MLVCRLSVVEVKGVGDGPGPRVPPPVLVCIGIAFSPYIAAAGCLIHVYYYLKKELRKFSIEACGE